MKRARVPSQKARANLDQRRARSGHHQEDDDEGPHVDTELTSDSESELVVDEAYSPPTTSVEHRRPKHGRKL